jgi:hypothetical protein
MTLSMHYWITGLFMIPFPFRGLYHHPSLHDLCLLFHHDRPFDRPLVLYSCFVVLVADP